MPRKKIGWTCQRVTKGQRCQYHNSPRARICMKCGKPRPVRKQPAHMRALKLNYEEYITVNGGERCGICGRTPSSRRRLDRDHDHKTGEARGLLCARCNRALPAWITSKWLQAAAMYLDRATNRLTNSIRK